MKERACQTVSEERLVAYTDGELSPSQAEQISEHIATCSDCQALAEALERSLQVTQAIWQTSHTQWPETHSSDRITSGRQPLRKVAAVVACAMLLVGVDLMWRFLIERGETTRVIAKEPTAGEIEIKANEAALAAQMLAVADLLAAQPGGEKYAAKRYTYVIDSFPGRDESEQAKLRLQNLLERRVKQ